MFLENFELPYKFGSNLGFKASGNSVISVNSTRGRHLTVGQLPTSSRRACGHLWLRAGRGKAAAWLLLASELRYKAYAVAVLLRFFSPVFPDNAAVTLSKSCHRRSAFLVSAKLAIAPSTPCKPNRPVLGD